MTACRIARLALLLALSLASACAATRRDYDFYYLEAKNELNSNGEPRKFVKGLQPGHGWERGKLLYLVKPFDRSSASKMPQALLVVVNPLEDLVEVELLASNVRGLEGLEAQPIGKERVVRFGRFIGTLTLRADTPAPDAVLDLGAQDHVGRDDEYQVLARDTQHPIGVVVVKDLGGTTSIVRPKNAISASLEGATAVLVKPNPATLVGSSAPDLFPLHLTMASVVGGGALIAASAVGPWFRAGGLTRGLEQDCPDCTEGVRSETQRKIERLDAAANGLLYGGVGLTLAGSLLWVGLARSQRGSSEVRPEVSPQGFGVQSRWRF